MTASLYECVHRVVSGVRESVGDVASARAMPPEAYTSPDFFEFELDAVFRRSWLYLCHVSEIASPGDQLAVTVAEEPLLVTRDLDRGINVLSAVCRHRAYVIPVEDEPVKHLRCPYHSWTYGLDGRLTSAPSMSPGHTLEELKATICLPRLRVEVFHGMVFANFHPDAAPLTPTLHRLEPALAPYRLEDLVVARSFEFPDLAFNWKNMQENALEEYHTTYVHKGLHDNAPANLVEHSPFEPGDGAVFRHAGLIIKGGEPVAGRPTWPVIPGLPERERGYMLFVTIAPLMFAAVRPDGVKMFRIIPQAADRMTLKISFLYPPSTLELDDFESMIAKQIALIDRLDLPDMDTNTRAYRGLKSKFAPRGPYSPQEASLPQFNQWLLERYVAAMVEV